MSASSSDPSPPDQVAAPTAAPPKKRPVLKNVLLLVIVAILALVTVVAVQPSQFSVTRSLRMDATPEAPFAQVNDFHNWANWSPWEKLDPNLQRTFSGEPAGTGAVYAWAGNDQVGEGRMTIQDSQPNELIRIQLEFLKPMVATNTTKFTFQPDGEGTLVTWTMSGENDFVGKAFCLLMNMDQMIGGDFEKGLANLKSVVEAKE